MVYCIFFSCPLKEMIIIYLIVKVTLNHNITIKFLPLKIAWFILFLPSRTTVAKKLRTSNLTYVWTL